MSILEENKDKIIQDYNSGKSTIKLAKDYGVGVYRIDKLLKQNNVVMRRQREALQLSNRMVDYSSEAMDRLEQAKKRYDEGNSLENSVKGLNISVERLKIYANITHRREYKINYRQIPAELQIILKRKYEDGYGIHRLSQMFRISPPVIKRHLLQNNVKLRTQKESVNHPLVNHFREKSYIENYGTKHPSHNTHYFLNKQKSGFKYKNYTLDGVSFSRLQGYEPYGILYIVKTLGIQPKNIITGRNENIPEIYYTLNGKKSRYYPDIYVEDINTIFEIKSNYTYNQYLDRNIAKKEAAIKLGYTHITLIFDRKGNLIKQL